MFGRKKAEPKTVLILDIESGSVGAALARREGDTMTILHEWREHLPVRTHRAAADIARDLERLVSRAALKMSEFAAKLRTQSPESGLGDVSRVSVFMAPPWGKPNLESGAPDFVPHLQEAVNRELSPYFPAKTHFHTSAGAAAHGLRHIAPQEDKYLLAIVTHEMTELLLVYKGAVVGHATIPHGINLPLRTMKTHGGFSDHEARSALKLEHASEPLSAAIDAYAGEFLAAGRELFDAYTPERIWVVSPAGDFFARALAHPDLGDLFPQGGEVRALRPHQALPKLGPAAQSQDIFIILEALFVLYS